MWNTSEKISRILHQGSSVSQYFQSLQRRTSLNPLQAKTFAHSVYPSLTYGDFSSYVLSPRLPFIQGTTVSLFSDAMMNNLLESSTALKRISFSRTEGDVSYSNSGFALLGTRPVNTGYYHVTLDYSAATYRFKIKRFSGELHGLYFCAYCTTDDPNEECPLLSVPIQENQKYFIFNLAAVAPGAPPTVISAKYPPFAVGGWTGTGDFFSFGGGSGTGGFFSVVLGTHETYPDYLEIRYVPAESASGPSSRIGSGDASIYNFTESTSVDYVLITGRFRCDTKEDGTVDYTPTAILLGGVQYGKNFYAPRIRSLLNQRTPKLYNQPEEVFSDFPYTPMWRDPISGGGIFYHYAGYVDPSNDESSSCPFLNSLFTAFNPEALFPGEQYHYGDTNSMPNTPNFLYGRPSIFSHGPRLYVGDQPGSSSFEAYSEVHYASEGAGASGCYYNKEIPSVDPYGVGGPAGFVISW